MQKLVDKTAIFCMIFLVFIINEAINIDSGSRNITIQEWHKIKSV